MFDLNGDKARLNGTDYVVKSIAHSNIVDSFVANTNKVGKGSGEARLYVSSQGDKLSSAFFNFSRAYRITKGSKTYIGCPSNCFFSKDNLQKYMEDAKSEYAFPTQKHRSDISGLYKERVQKINSLTDEINFQIYNQNGDLDSSRFYIGSADAAWEIMREISLPKITSLDIYKLVNASDPSDIQYYFEIYLNMNNKTKKKVSRNNSEERIEKKIINDTKITETEKQTVIKARKGQGKFRNNTLSIMPSCPFTGVSKPSLLRASHIMPWADCENNEQRLDGYNGMSLTPTYDVLFDLGLISFMDDGSLMISPKLDASIRGAFNLVEGITYDIANSSGDKNNYLKYHRENIFKK